MALHAYHSIIIVCWFVNEISNIGLPKFIKTCICIDAHMEYTLYMWV